MKRASQMQASQARSRRGREFCQAEPVSSEVNRRMWDERAPAHAASPEYGLARFASDPDHLSDVVRFDRPRLGDISGLRGVHLQCHIGTDTVSLSRLGARMSGLDFSAAAIAVARDLAANAGADIDFHVADVYDAVDVLGAGRLRPGLHRHRGARLAARHGPLGPGGRPTCSGPAAGCSCARDIRCCGRWPTRGPDGLVVVEYPYFTPAEPTVWDEEGTYVTTEVDVRPHRLPRVEPRSRRGVTALLDAGMVVTGLVEHDSVPWNARPGEMEESDGEWRMRDRPERFPCTYTLQARKP